MSSKEAIDVGGSRRRGSGPKAGSVWESRMRIDDVKGGFKVFNVNHPTSPENSSVTNSTTVNNPEIQMDKRVPKQSPVGKRRTWKSESLEGSPVKIASLRSELSKNLEENCKELNVSPLPIKKTRSGLPNGNNGGQLRKVKSDFTEVTDDSKSEGNFELSMVKSNGNLKAKSGVEREDLDERIKNCEESRSDEDCKELAVCEEKGITNNGGEIKIQSDNDENEVDLGEDGKIEVENKNFDVKEISVEDHKPKKGVIEEKKLVNKNEKSVPIAPIVKKQPPSAVNHARLHPTPTKINPISDNSHGVSRTNSKLQSFVDLVMWKDVPKSAFVFGIGTFAIISSSYTKDLNISFISVLSYLGLVYLAAIFLFRSLISRGSVGMDNANQDYLLGEEEAVWVVKLLLPYVNEFLLKLRALFSGDPATTMKLAVLLFILARCGRSITIWKMAKLGFIGVFTVPKVCSTYSSQLTAYGTFWIRRFRDAWDSCSHKKAVGFAIFTLIWNLSSVVARIWAVFMLFAAFKYYQQSLIKDGWAEDGMSSDDSSSHRQSNGGQQLGRRPTLIETRKQKKVH